MFLKGNICSFLLAFMFVISSGVKAAQTTVSVPVKIDLTGGTGAIAEVTGGATEFDDSKYTMVTVPLVLAVDHDGRVYQILDPEFVAEKLIAEMEPASSENTGFLPIDEDIQTCSLMNGCGCMGNGFKKLIEGIGRVSAGSIIVLYIVSSKTSKFLVTRTCKAAGFVFNKVYNYYAQQ